MACGFDILSSTFYIRTVCCRYSETVDPMELADVLAIDLCSYEFEPRPMIWPTETAPVIVRENGRTELRPMRWGLIPHWADDEKIGRKLINARSETAAQKPAFRDAWRNRRCLIPATGFYEWNHNANTGQKEPLHFHLTDNQLFCFAGLWERWDRPAPKQVEMFDSEFEQGPRTVESFTILTTSPNSLVEKYHDRMPVIDVRSPENWLESGEFSTVSLPDEQLKVCALN